MLRMASWKVVPAKTLCRLFAISNMFMGIFSIFYWCCMDSVANNIKKTASWTDLFLFLNGNVNTTVSENCGEGYLKNVSPSQVAHHIEKSIRFYIWACAIFGAKGLAQFFATYCCPCMAKLLCFLLLLVDLIATSLTFYGMFLFRQPELCVLEYTDLLYQGRQQSKMTALTFILALLLKPPEWLAVFCFISQQNKLLAKGETRSKGVRRSEAFRTPMSSRANSYVGGLHRKVTGKESLGLEQMNSDEDLEEEDNLKLFIRNGKCKFIEIDLNESENNNDSNRNGGEGDNQNFKANNNNNNNTDFH
ncbi:hypothetical protein Ocin01_02230 [Orchesella cincta]|uniref:Uncharacterized protein n=1 Tax=Orchesella cincta TaxID=48709 RepID=A0A1D2NGU1_ORCCI|nr:hypothetical protein Ocin01_02230 [Orchesella cincta]